ncbi:Aste57867_1236 [Aphanomyces stellatus]|uniref:Aste57867_1236 protein n=1 Tax=Aphanomyces stellatus TaxID=120398 RepID=A0A485KA56_9STRA|nr:hypothetical protein As57867_001235 [Aphanomyces stellatus]VFT78455.1 Aste57867_1236 [Aphanomyces stellatus]
MADAFVASSKAVHFSGRDRSSFRMERQTKRTLKQPERDACGATQSAREETIEGVVIVEHTKLGECELRNSTQVETIAKQHKSSVLEETLVEMLQNTVLTECTTMASEAVTPAKADKSQPQHEVRDCDGSISLDNNIADEDIHLGCRKDADLHFIDLAPTSPHKGETSSTTLAAADRVKRALPRQPTTSEATKSTTEKTPAPPPKVANIIVGGFAGEDIQPIARSIHLLELGRVVLAKAEEEVVAMCRTSTWHTGIDLICFVVGRNLDKAVSMLTLLMDLVGSRVVLIGGDSLNPSKTDAVMYQCNAIGALCFATMPVDYTQLGKCIRSTFAASPQKYIVYPPARKKVRPMVRLYKALSKRGNAKQADVLVHPPKDTTVQSTIVDSSRTWFQNDVKLPSLRHLAKTSFSKWSARGKHLLETPQPPCDDSAKAKKESSARTSSMKPRKPTDTPMKPKKMRRRLRRLSAKE